MEKIIHPLVEKERNLFLENFAKYTIVGLDIPLLYETKMDKKCNYVFLVNTSKRIQKKRVLQRENMNEKRFSQIWRNQISYSKINKKLVSLKIETNSSEDLIRIKIKQFLKNILI